MNLLERVLDDGLAPDEFTARGLILSGKVLLDDQPVSRPGAIVKPGNSVRVRGESRYVSRSAEKLLGALEDFSVSVDGLLALDVGSSTGGFTQVLLEKGARRVIALDVGTNQLDYGLRKDLRVTVLEKTHICSVSPEHLPFVPDFFTADVSFISLRKVLPCIRNIVSKEAKGIILFKPQFEIEKERSHLLEKGVLHDENLRLDILASFLDFLSAEGIVLHGHAPARIAGSTGNQEEVVLIQF